MEDENVETLREAYQPWNDSKADSVSRWMSLLADDVQWSSIADGSPGMEFSQACCSKDDVARYFEVMVKEWEMIHYTVDEFIAQNDRVVVLGRCGWRHKGTSKVVETPKADIIRMKDPKITEFYEFYDTAKAFEASR